MKSLLYIINNNHNTIQLHEALLGGKNLRHVSNSESGSGKPLKSLEVGDILYSAQIENGKQKYDALKNIKTLNIS